MTATKIQSGDDTHLTLLMAPHSLNLVTGADRAALLAYGRDVFSAGQAGAAPAAVAPQGVVAWMHPETLNVISAAHKHDMSTEYGAETRRKAESYSVALVRAGEPAAAAPALEAPAAPAVPLKATPEMRAAFRLAYRGGAYRERGLWGNRIDYALDRMLAAAPQDQTDAQCVAAWRQKMQDEREGDAVVAMAFGAGRRAAAAPQAPAAPDDAEMLAALRAVAMDVVYVGAGENTISDSARAKVETVLEKIGTPWPSPAAAPAAPAVDARDTARMDWLEAQVVNVRAPLRYGSRDMFWASPEEVDGGPDGPSDLRARIDAAQAKEGGA